MYRFPSMRIEQTQILGRGELAQVPQHLRLRHPGWQATACPALVGCRHVSAFVGLEGESTRARRGRRCTVHFNELSFCSAAVPRSPFSK